VNEVAGSLRQGNSLSNGGTEENNLFEVRIYLSTSLEGGKEGSR
jgi:hypothetical protein